MDYPLINEKALARLESRLFRRTRREDVPELPPGATYVFQVDGNWRELPTGTRFDPSHSDVLDASAVSLVDLRVRIVQVDWEVPSQSEASRFTLRASFTCQVTDPVAVVRCGITDVTAPLGAYLRRDTKLAGVGSCHSMHEVNVVREQATHRMQAYSAINPPDIEGMAVEFLAVEVLTPADVARHEQDLISVARTGELDARRHTFENINTQRLVGLIEQGGDWLNALAVARGEVAVGQLANERRAAEGAEANRTAEREALAAAREYEAAVQRGNLEAQLVLRLLEQMGGSESFVDYHQILQQVLEGRSGEADAGASPSALGPGRGGGGTGFAKPSRAQRPQDEFIGDEEGLLD
ncbi:hypothetical protein [Streptacidiphilus sp. P02-A3a]|uniref:hypothetical protein n=1 Tax=Streptacidiphilus sp. P02-A3a TaxID=2704468 RepID=UPI0015FBC9AA|nr:hypothetical protein [Streptacidiphilus sp. P02-A3a]QMU73324.1 hypothetical protein GXP74_38965 [Streptacidiphilus sp. P02-A3a]